MRVATMSVALSAIAVLFAGNASAEAVTYKLDPNHTIVLAQWDHFGYSHPVANFGQVDGTLVYDAADDAIVISGTLRDFDFYNPEVIETFGEFIRETRIPVLAICGGHQLVGLSFGARVLTLDRLEEHEERVNRPLEYQYRFVRITDSSDPIFRGIANPSSGL